jgi:hypothetical protein
VNATVHFTNPIHYEEAKETRRIVEKDYMFAHVIGSIDPLIYKGHKILLNMQSSEHFNCQDPKRRFAVMAAFGYHKR